MGVTIGPAASAAGLGQRRVPAGHECGPGAIRGRHHSAWHAEVKRLLDIGNEAAAEQLLLKICDATEAESQAEGYGVAPAAYERLAVIYSRRKDRDSEIAILERFAHNPHAPGASPPQLLDRLKKLRASDLI